MTEDEVQAKIEDELAPPLPAGVPQPDRRRHRLPPPDAGGDRADRRDPAAVLLADGRGPGHPPHVDAGGARFLAARGYDPTFGARPLKRLIQKEVSDALARQNPDRRDHSGRRRRRSTVSPDRERIEIVPRTDRNR